MSLLEAVTAVANEAGYTVSTSVISSSDTTTKQLLAIAQRVIKEMAIAYPWPKLYASGTITLAAGTQMYELPAAFSYYHYDTFWNSSTRWRILGPLSPQDFGDLEGYGLTATVYQQFQIRGIANNQLYIYPEPASSGDIVIFQYIADRAVRPQTWAAATVFAVNAYCFYNGNYYQTTSGGTGGSAPTHTSGTTGIWTYYSGAYSSFLADTDEPVLPQRVLEQGMLERFAEIHQLSVLPRYSDQLNEEFSKSIPGKVLAADSNLPGYVQQARSGTVVFGGPG